MKCPHCSQNIDVQFIKAPANAQPPTPANNGSAGTADLEELLDMIDASSLSGQTLDFVVQTRERFKKYKSGTRMSDKQMSWLRKIASGESENEW